MNQEWEEALSALADGEDVDPAVVEAALATPEARANLVEILRLRRLVRADLDTPRPVNAEAWSRLRRRGWMRVAAAAVIVMFAGLGAVDLVQRLDFKPGGEDPPKPVRVVRFEPGVDWHPVQANGGRP